MSELRRYTPIGTRGMTPCTMGEWVRFSEALAVAGRHYAELLPAAASLYKRNGIEVCE